MNIVLSVKVALVEAARLDLMASKEKLEEDIRVKKNSIAIDQVTVMMLIFMRIVTRTPKPDNCALCTMYMLGKAHKNDHLIEGPDFRDMEIIIPHPLSLRDKTGMGDNLAPQGRLAPLRTSFPFSTQCSVVMRGKAQRRRFRVSTEM